jgi:hypothetical protein
MQDDNTFPEQTAPEKNTDQAFVQVGPDGSPVVPPVENKEEEVKKEENKTTLDKR